MAGSPPQYCLLWGLPQELIDMIFGLAFQRPAHSKTIYRTNWELRENHHKKKNFSGYEKRAFPRRKVEDILVSKRFFTTASQAWFSTHTWTIDHAQWYYSSAYQFLTQENGLFTQYARGLIVNYTCLARPISKMIGLRELEMQLDEYTFDGLELPDRYAWEHRLEEHELAGLPMLETIGQMTRLNSFSLSLEEQWYIYAKTDSQVELLRTNIKALESVFLERMEVAKWKHASTSRRKSKSPPRACVPLYYGSQNKVPRALGEDLEDYALLASQTTGSKSSNSSAATSSRLSIIYLKRDVFMMLKLGRIVEGGRRESNVESNRNFRERSCLIELTKAVQRIRYKESPRYVLGVVGTPLDDLKSCTPYERPKQTVPEFQTLQNAEIKIDSAVPQKCLEATAINKNATKINNSASIHQVEGPGPKVSASVSVRFINAPKVSIFNRRHAIRGDPQSRRQGDLDSNTSAEEGDFACGEG